MDTQKLKEFILLEIVERRDYSASKMCEIILSKIEKLEKEKLRVELNHYHSECGDGCCTNYGTITTVNGVEMEVHNQDAGTILREVLIHLGYKAEIIELDNGEEI